MGIDFRAPANRRTYSDRDADPTWREAVLGLVDPDGATVVDVGCGGGTYTRAWHELGAAAVIGVDSSEPILAEARRSHGELPRVAFHLGRGHRHRAAGGFRRRRLRAGPDPPPPGPRRLRRRGGASAPARGSAADPGPHAGRCPSAGPVDHPRRWLFDIHPQLLAVEDSRRPTPAAVTGALSAPARDDRDQPLGGPTPLRRPRGLPERDRAADRAVDPARPRRHPAHAPGRRAAPPTPGRTGRRARPVDDLAGRQRRPHSYAARAGACSSAASTPPRSRRTDRSATEQLRTRCCDPSGLA